MKQKQKNKKPLNEIGVLDRGINILKDMGKKLNFDCKRK